MRRSSAILLSLLSLPLLACGPLSLLRSQQQPHGVPAGCDDLAGRSDIVFCEDFESSTWMTDNNWVESGISKAVEERQTRATHPQHILHGEASLRIASSTVQAGAGRANLARRHLFRDATGTPVGYDRLFYRWYVKFEDGPFFQAGGTSFNVKGNALYGFRMDYERACGKDYPATPDTDAPCADTFSNRASASTRTREPHIHGYLNGNPDSQQYFASAARPAIQPNTWHCIEVELMANDIGIANGATRLWFDGTLAIERTGLLLRTRADSKIRAVDNIYRVEASWNSGQTIGPVVRWEDSLVVATNRIGCTAAQAAPVVVPDVPTDELQRRIVQAALSANGKPYTQAAGRRAGPDSFDCSGLVWWAYQQAGITVGSVASQQAQNGRRIPCTLNDVNGRATRCWQPGDLIFLAGYCDTPMCHVALYVGAGLFADCLNPQRGCLVWRPAGHYYESYFSQARRILP